MAAEGNRRTHSGGLGRPGTSGRAGESLALQPLPHAARRTGHFGTGTEAGPREKLVSPTVPFLLLNSESPADITPEIAERRTKLVAQMRTWPDDAFSRLQMLQTEDGCFNVCAFCCQGAATKKWSLTSASIKDMFSAIKTVATDVAERREHVGPDIVGYDRPHRPGVIFPYMDNDIGSSTDLLDVARYSYEDLGVRLRLATVGYSRNNPQLQSMHEMINSQYPDSIAAIRFSFTPYTQAMARPDMREEYVQDLANAIKTYRPVIDRVGLGAETANVALRFKPSVETFTEDLTDTEIAGHHVIQIGPHLLVAKQKTEKPPLSHVVDLDRANNNEVIYDNPSSNYVLVTSDKLVRDGNWRTTANAVIESGVDAVTTELDPDIASIREVELYKIAHPEGAYYSTNPGFNANGEFNALHLYPQTEQRKKSGYINSERPFLNAVLEHKASNGLGRRDPFEGATLDDIAEVIRKLYTRAETLSQIDAHQAQHLRDNIIPMILDYARVVEIAELPPSYFFDRRFSVDTGEIVNQGRAKSEFKGLTEMDDIPLTPRMERGYGKVSFSAERGRVWRIAPNPWATDGLTIARNALGAKNVSKSEGAITAYELDTRGLLTVTPEGEQLRKYTVTGVDIVSMSMREGREHLLLPGLPIKLAEHSV